MMTFLRSMAGRVFLILLVGIVVSATLTLWLAFGERQRTISQFRDLHAVERAEELIVALDAMPATGRQPFLNIAKRFGLRLQMVSAPQPEAAAPSRFALALGERMGKDYRIVSLAGAVDCPPPPGRKPPDGEFGAGNSMRPACQAIGITLRDGSLMQMTVLPPRGPPPMPMLRPDFLSYFVLFLASIGFLAFIVTRMTMQPLKQLVQAADDLGRDINRPPLPEHGASEIRRATVAFNAMQARIRQHIGQRTQMLAAITHDLQTPLTRLRLRLEKVSNEELRDKLVGDLSAMQQMVREGLDLARSMDSAEPMQPLDLDSLLDSVCSDACDAGQNVKLDGKSALSVLARPTALRRCLTNLIDNAVKYGYHAHITVQRSQGSRAGARIRIRDGGPGIAADQLAKVFEPFYRIETSRSRDTGGTGLGLTIARNIVEQHGGSLTLANHPDGGLEVTLTLPQNPRTER
ncbi:ATP-binding protein [Undibacterium arcticum]|uniref:histidine kinase n=1 Tax=Undibacterium arcticum TaxID=1762892 RepID=A0ABV7EXW8_9BURK